MNRTFDVHSTVLHKRYTYLLGSTIAAWSLECVLRTGWRTFHYSTVSRR